MLHSEARVPLLTCCHLYAQNVGSGVSVIALNGETEAIQVSFDWLQEGAIFKTDLNINGVLLSCRMTRGN